MLLWRSPAASQARVRGPVRGSFLARQLKLFTAVLWCSAWRWAHCLYAPDMAFALSVTAGGRQRVTVATFGVIPSHRSAHMHSIPV